ncbi:hypothetical protein [Bradyrhizobium oligotrophicum]|uniref:hypothetical protein n=1 Tax=Bradyrhizobium oligotrophicum TaxID=44255 RepID=UPI003EBBF9E2
MGIKAELEKGLDRVDELTPLKDTEIAKLDELPRIEFRDGDILRFEYVDKLLPFLYENASPEALLLDTWSRVEGEMRAMMDALHPSNSDSIHVPPPPRFEAAAEELGLSGHEIESLSVLRKLRNRIAHSADRSLAWEDATRFKESSHRLLDKMKKNWDELRKKKG